MSWVLMLYVIPTNIKMLSGILFNTVMISVNRIQYKTILPLWLSSLCWMSFYSMVILGVIMLSVVLLSGYAGCHNDQCRHAECHFAQCLYWKSLWSMPSCCVILISSYDAIMFNDNLLSVILFSDYTGCYYDQCHHAESDFAQCLYWMLLWSMT